MSSPCFKSTGFFLELYRTFWKDRMKLGHTKDSYSLESSVFVFDVELKSMLLQNLFTLLVDSFVLFRLILVLLDSLISANASF